MTRHAVKLSALFSEATDELDWQRDALCSQVDPDLWYPEKGGSGFSDAKSVCARCPVRAACLEHALEHETRGEHGWGIWGGMTTNERKAVLRRRDAEPEPNAARLTRQVAADIRERYAAEPPISQAELALQYGVSRSAIAQIVQGRTWKQVPA